MKYEPLSGNQSLFTGARENTVAICKVGENLTLEFHKYEELLAFLQQKPLCDRPDIAMRRIIAEPKRWTVEDKKAGRLPEVGCEYIGRGVLLTCVFVDKNRGVWGKSKDNIMYCHEDLEIEPIETPKEKAARLRSEWCNKAAKQLKNLEYSSTLTSIYDALQSGELPVPGKDGE